MSSPERLLEILRNKGAALQGWEESVTTVRRELFLPDTIETPHGTVSRDASPDVWLTAVYGDLPLTTQVNDGRPTEDGEYRLPTSSSSMPSMMLEMLDLLQVADGHRVLDVGAGTGLQAAWLAHRLGSGNVTAVDVDPVLVEQAAKNVRAAGYSPHVVCGDGAAGWPHGAPYDRIIASYTVPEIPYAWVEQVPRGRIVAPWGGSFFSHSFAALDVSDGEAHGRFSGYPAFMRSRTARPPRGFLRDFLHHQEEAVETRTTVDPLEIARDADAQFWIGLFLPDAWHVEIEAEDGSDEVTWWLLADDRSSWAAADHVPGQHEYVIAQYGPRRLWDEALHAWRTWRRHGSPPRDRAGITVTPDDQHVWLDEPGRVIASTGADGPGPGRLGP
ncbi:methyltransferase domain-containing protein [Streptomyces daliensis]|uniref:Protein-L-isoaspartate O-methyltransferase n=1 Tax=Streptomyces daliensis TaxID=299421 RepID=A0A8T4J529_9ACTN|nr:methyltransferase domain-containing protein [Streptomyces daliensis]